MTDWHARVRAHLRQRALELPDEVVEELATHLEDAWDAADGPAGDAAGIDAFVAARAAARRPGASWRAAPRGRASTSARARRRVLVSGLGGELRHTLRLLRRAPVFRRQSSPSWRSASPPRRRPSASSIPRCSRRCPIPTPIAS